MRLAVPLRKLSPIATLSLTPKHARTQFQVSPAPIAYYVFISQMIFIYFYYLVKGKVRVQTLSLNSNYFCVFLIKIA
jgi:hypothetical protein